jgi:hypothetical protein
VARKRVWRVTWRVARERVACGAPVALEGSMVTMKSAPAAHSLADAAGMPPAALSFCIASALRLREALGGPRAAGGGGHLKSKPRTVKPPFARLAAMGPPLHTRVRRCATARAKLGRQTCCRVR